MPPVSEYAERWLARLLSTQPTDRQAVEESFRQLYAAANLPTPKIFLWHDSPVEALWTFGALSETHDHLTAAFVTHVRQRSDSLARFKATQENIQTRLDAATWQDAAAAVGRWHSQGSSMTTDGIQLLPFALMLTRTNYMMATLGIQGYTKYAKELDPAFEPLQAAQRQVFGHFGDGILAYGAARAGCEALRAWMGHTGQRDYAFIDMARDEMFTDEHGSAPGLLQAYWRIAEQAGIWWPFEHGVVLAERPVEVQRDAKQQLTLVYKDGWKAEPYSNQSKESAKKPIRKPAAASSLVTKALPRDPAERLALLRKHSPKLPRYERYLAGEREAVWRELVDLGAGVRDDAHAADALAVAYETMTRVDQNVRTIIERLNAIGYRFETDASKSDARMDHFGGVMNLVSDMLQTTPASAQSAKHAGALQQAKGIFETLMKTKAAGPQSNTPKPHVPPSPQSAKAMQKLDKLAKGIPLSLRAFYDVVGEVNLLGEHPQIAPRESSVTPDPLVVCGIDEAIESLEMYEDDPQIVLAPDALHKADVSGGDGYSIRVPAPFADALVEFEPHGVTFVEYLRVVFAWGGFPGWQQADAILPREIEALRQDLLPI